MNRARRGLRSKDRLARRSDRAGATEERARSQIWLVGTRRPWG